MSIRGTQRERKFMYQSIPSLLKINPTEIIFGLDEGIDNELKQKISDICKAGNFDNYRIIETPKDDSWNFQLANNVWNCIHQAKYDKIYFCDVDTLIQKNVLIAYDLLGENNLAVCSFTTQLRTKTWNEKRANFFYRLRVLVSSPNEEIFSGCYWTYRPYYLQNIKEKDYKKITNGIDSFMYKTIKNNKIHNIMTRKEVGTHQLDQANGDYEWRQFAEGMWWYANRNLMYYERKRKRSGLWKKMHNEIKKISKFFSKILEFEKRFEKIYQDSNLPLKWLARRALKISIGIIENIIIEFFVKYRRITDKDPYYGVLCWYAFKTGRPIMKDGYMWAKEHSDIPIIKIASTLPIQEWGYLGGKVLKDVDRKFDRIDSTGGGVK